MGKAAAVALAAAVGDPDAALFAPPSSPQPTNAYAEAPTDPMRPALSMARRFKFRVQ